VKIAQEIKKLYFGPTRPYIKYKDAKSSGVAKGRVRVKFGENRSGYKKVVVWARNKEVVLWTYLTLNQVHFQNQFAKGSDGRDNMVKIGRGIRKLYFGHT